MSTEFFFLKKPWEILENLISCRKFRTPYAKIAEIRRSLTEVAKPPINESISKVFFLKTILKSHSM